MAAPSSHSFASPDAPGDACVVLVLLESSPNMASFWTHLQGYYLPTILGALQSGTPDTPIHVYWQMTADPDNIEPTYTNSSAHIPDAGFDSAVPLSIDILRRAVDTLRAVELVGRATRHLLIIAANPPQDPANFLPNGSYSPDAATRESVMTTLSQDRIRLHMVLVASPRLQVLRDFHHYLLRAQISVEIPPWFQVDPRRFTVHLVATPAAYEGGDGGPLQAHGASSILPRAGPATPTSTAAALPVASHSPSNVSTQSQPGSPPSPARRTTRHKGKETIVPAMDPQGPGLVNYLKQVHGLTKRKGAGGKTSKRTAASEPSRSSRPILPRLELPVASLSAPAGAERSPTKPAHAVAPPPMEPSKQAGPSAQPPVATMGRPWPWIQPMPITSPPDAPSLSPTANAALRNLTRLAPRAPLPGTQGQQSGGQAAVHPVTAYADAQHGSSPSPSAAMAQLQRQEMYPPYGVGSSPSPPQRFQSSSSSPPYHPAVATSYQATEGSPPTWQSTITHEIPHPSVYANAPYYNAYPYAISPHNSDHSNPSPPMPSPAVTAAPAVHAPDDTENQPFVVTPEYEAMANARFAAAVRSGAVHANMAPNVLPPITTSPAHGSASYFSSSNPMMHPAPSGMPTTEYAYVQQEDARLGHDVVHYSSMPGRTSEHANYYQHPGGDASSPPHQWYEH